MTQKNETLTLLFSLVITGGILGAAWWFFKGGLLSGTQNTPNTSSSTFSEVKQVPNGLFNYGGSTTWAPIRKDVDPVISSVWPQFQLRYTDPITGTPGSGNGIKMLIQNELAFSQSSRSLKPEEYQKAQNNGFKLKEIPVAIDGLAIAVNPRLKLAGLTLNQLKDIYTGKITNWKQVGGEDLPIIPYSRSLADGGTVEFFKEHILAGESFGPSVQYTRDTTDGLRKVTQNLGGIYYASAPEVVPQCRVRSLPLGRKVNEWVTPYQEPFIPLEKCPTQRNQINKKAFRSGDYPITRRLFVIVKQNGQLDEQAGEAYANLMLTAQGQSLIDKSGYISLR